MKFIKPITPVRFKRAYKGHIRRGDWIYDYILEKWNKVCMFFVGQKIADYTVARPIDKIEPNIAIVEKVIKKAKALIPVYVPKARKCLASVFDGL
jgi:hypothetical protein